MTPQLLDFIQKLELRVGSVLEIGSFNVNGSARTVIQAKQWLGTDMRAGPDVDMVINGLDLNKYFGPIFDLVVCLETLEHCEDWKGVLQSAWSCIMPGGALLLSTPGADFPQHDYPSDYHRFSLDIWHVVFRDHRIMAEADIFYPHNGHILFVQKTGPDIELNVQALPVP